ncbi:Uncharacterised protein [Staphylococcus piscifermentans]|uniref:Uncharacterized protein n=1 Tax=Staphylococcus piscifermentans TaxID=70258 RepID=A0A239TE58_9STAP|nr:hypothetical protein [Staphylococcus piscifermentans]GEP83714.1 hypothetical protein SPI02_02990 [Staphylococcus piscifermentans]SNU95859.1 Uncharacterised protein [Staphylococcus piscifermentans]
MKKLIKVLLPLFIIFKIRDYFLKLERQKFEEIDIESDEDRYSDEDEEAARQVM